MKCFSAIAKFHGDKQPRLFPSVVSHLRLVLEPMTATFGSKCRCPSTAEENNVSGNSSRSTKKSRLSGIGEGKSAGQRKKAVSGIFLGLISLANLALVCFS